MTTLVGSETIRFHFLSLRAAVKLEKKGMTRRGRSAKSIAITELQLPKNSNYDTVINALTKKLGEEYGTGASSHL